MSKSNLALIALSCAVAGVFNPYKALAATAPSRLIVPGHSIGRLDLGRNGTRELSRQPTATASDAGMSQTRQVWVSPAPPHYTLFVHTVSNGALNVRPLHGVTINEIRVTSPYFRTRQGIATGDTLAQVRRAVPGLHRLSSGRVTGNTVIYDDARHGIAFEFARSGATARCIGITVYIAGNGPSAGYPVSRYEVEQTLQSGALAPH